MKKSTKDLLQMLFLIVLLGILLGAVIAYAIKNFPAFYYSINNTCSTGFSDGKLAVLMSIVPIGVIMGLAALSELWVVQRKSRRTSRYVPKKYLVVYGTGSVTLLLLAFYMIQC